MGIIFSNAPDEIKRRILSIIDRVDAPKSFLVSKGGVNAKVNSYIIFINADKNSSYGNDSRNLIKSSVYAISTARGIEIDSRHLNLFIDNILKDANERLPNVQSGVVRFNMQAFNGVYGVGISFVNFKPNEKFDDVQLSKSVMAELGLPALEGYRGSIFTKGLQVSGPTEIDVAMLRILSKADSMDDILHGVDMASYYCANGSDF